TDHHRLPGRLRSEAERDQGRAEKARDRHPNRQQRHEHGRHDHDVAEVAQAYTLTERCRAGRSRGSYDFAPLCVDRFQLFLRILIVGALRHWVIWIIDAEASSDPLELLSCRVSRKQMTLHMPEQTRHLTKYVFGWYEVEELSLCRVKIALRPLDKRPVAEDPADKNEGSLWVQRLRTCRLPGCLKMAANGVGQNLTVLRCGARLFRLRPLPIAQRSQFLSPRH